MEKEIINGMYYAPYSSLSAVLSNHKVFLNPRIKELYTIIIYLGNGLYKDLITDNIYQGHHLYGIQFEHQSQKSNADDFYRAMIYPIYINPNDIKPVEGSIIEKIISDSEEISSIASSSIQYNINNLRALYEIELAKRVEEEYNIQTQKDNKETKPSIVKRLNNR